MKPPKVVFSPISIDMDPQGHHLYAYIEESKICVGTRQVTWSEKPMRVIESPDFTVNVPHVVMYRAPNSSMWRLLSSWDPVHGYGGYEGPTRIGATKIITPFYTKNDIRERFPTIKTDYGQVGLCHGVLQIGMNYSHMPIETCQPIFAEFVIRKPWGGIEASAHCVDTSLIAAELLRQDAAAFFRVKRGPLRSLLWEYTRLRDLKRNTKRLMDDGPSAFRTQEAQALLKNILDETQKGLEERRSEFRGLHMGEVYAEPILWRD